MNPAPAVPAQGAPLPVAPPAGPAAGPGPNPRPTPVPGPPPIFNPLPNPAPPPPNYITYPPWFTQDDRDYNNARFQDTIYGADREGNPNPRPNFRYQGPFPPGGRSPLGALPPELRDPPSPGLLYSAGVGSGPTGSGANNARGQRSPGGWIGVDRGRDRDRAERLDPAARPRSASPPRSPTRNLPSPWRPMIPPRSPESQYTPGIIFPAPRDDGYEYWGAMPRSPSAISSPPPPLPQRTPEQSPPPDTGDTDVTGGFTYKGFDL